MIDDIKEITEEVLYRLDAYSDDALALVMRTGMAESGYRTLRQRGSGPAIGFWQVELDTAQDTLDNFVDYREKIKKRLIGLGLGNDLEFSLLSNIALQVAFCRLKYMRDPNPIPEWTNIEAQAKYWKKVYNTNLGAGTIEHFLEANKKDM
jgi:hypothetical protein